MASLNTHTYYATLAALKMATGGEETHVYCIELDQRYRYEVDGGVYTPDDKSVCVTGDGGNTRWLATGGKYGIVDTSSFSGILSTADTYLQKALNTIDTHTHGSSSSVEKFGAGMLLDLSEDPASGLVTNKGYFSESNFDVIGSWARTQTANGGYYWTKQDANVGGLRLRPKMSNSIGTASVVSFVLTALSSTLVLEDSSNNLQDLVSHLSHAAAPMMYKVGIYSTSSGNKLACGYLGSCSVDGNQYTFNIHAAQISGAQTWLKSTTTVDTPVYWVIYPAQFNYELNSVVHPGMTACLWYYSPDATTDNVFLMGKWDDFLANTNSQGWGLF